MKPNLSGGKTSRNSNRNLNTSQLNMSVTMDVSIPNKIQVE